MISKPANTADSGYAQNTSNTNRKCLRDLDFADDKALLVGHREGLQQLTNHLTEVDEGIGLRISREKTKVLKIGESGQDSRPITVGGQPVEDVNSFVYLGSVITKDGGTEVEAAAVFQKMEIIRASTKIDMKINFNCTIRSYYQQ